VLRGDSLVGGLYVAKGGCVWGRRGDEGGWGREREGREIEEDGGEGGGGMTLER